MSSENEIQTTTPPPLPPPSDPVGEGSDIEPIRTETIFSRMPLHVLSKSGPRPQINIERRTPEGRIDEKWKVSYNEEYGPARQLAYDIHTLIIERAIEEAFEEARRTGQPLPRLIPIDHLREIEAKLGLVEGNTNKIKRALFQNAGILITAFKRYRGNDGSEYFLEGVFTPYGVFLLGQKMPDGSRADKTFVNLNDAYFEAWSRGATRPLDYNYKAQLPPIPRRFYELVSYAMYGAIKNNQPTARYRYSEFCKNAPQLRYDTFDQVKKQMYKIHKPHVDGNYILKVKYQETTDEQGRVDWWMVYTPGQRAYTEFSVFAGKKFSRSVDAAAAGQLKAAGESGARRSRRPRQTHLPLQPEVDAQLLAALMGRGISETAARKLLTELPADYPTLDTLEWGDTQVSTSRGKITNPPGFYISLLRDRTTPPPAFESSQVRKARHEADLRKQQALQEEEARRLAEEEAEEQRLGQFQAAEPEAYRALYDQAKAELYSQFPNLARFAQGREDSAMHDGAIRSRIKIVLRNARSHAAAAFAASLQATLSTPQLPAPKLSPALPETDPL